MQASIFFNEHFLLDRVVCRFCITVEPPYNGHLETYLSGRCREVAVWGGYQLEDLSE